MLTIPLDIELDSERWTIERVWPAKPGDDRLPLEARSAGRIQAGYAHPDGTIELLPPGEDRRLPLLGSVAAAGELIAHRPGRRAVVRLADGGGYAKVVRRGRGTAVIDAHRSGHAFRAGFAVPGLAEHDFDPDQVVVFESIPGRSFSACGADPDLSDAHWQRAWDDWSQGWLATMAAADPSALPVHDVEDERRVIRDWAEHAASVLGDGEAIRSAGERVSELLSAAGAPSALSHRDLHDGQLLWDPASGIGLIDLDTCARADPALDLGNLAAHVDFARAQRRWSASRARIADAAISRTAAGLGIDAVRLQSWRRAARFRVACVNALRPRWRAVARQELVELRRTL